MGGGVGPEDLRGWIERTSRLSAEFGRGFEARFGYPPGENRVFAAGVAEERITVFGSDGGGSMFALSAAGGQVRRLRGGAFLDGILSELESQVVA